MQSRRDLMRKMENAFTKELTFLLRFFDEKKRWAENMALFVLINFLVENLLNWASFYLFFIGG